MAPRAAVAPPDAATVELRLKYLTRQWLAGLEDSAEWVLDRRSPVCDNCRCLAPAAARLLNCNIL